MKVTYLEHSGFAAEYKEYVLIFDWYRGSLPEFDQQKRDLCICQSLAL